MGTATARITAQDFVTPPEFTHWSLAASSAARIGGVRLELLPDAAGTSLGESYQQVPLQLLPPFRFGRERPSLLYLLNPTAGLMEGDAQLVQLVARQGSKAVVTGQSATRIHPSLRKFCTQQWEIRVEPQAILVVLPGPAIPFQSCRFYQRVNIHLDENASLIWGDLWFAGRYARGKHSEQFQFNTIIQELKVTRKENLVFRDRFCWQGPWDEQEATWHFGKHLAGGGLFVTGPIEKTCTSSGVEVELGFFPTGGNDTCIRFLGSSEKVTKALVKNALRVAAIRAGNSAQEPWLLPSQDLAPNHWFHTA
jgi:urease accessory protein